MTSLLRALLISPFLFVLFACGSSGPAVDEEESPDRSPNRLVVSEISAPVSDLTAYDLVKQYKSHWLWTPKTQSLQNNPEIQVYVNNSGGHDNSISSLTEYAAQNVSEIRYFSPRRAQFRFGIGNSAGAILVILKGGA